MGGKRVRGSNPTRVGSYADGRGEFVVREIKTALSKAVAAPRAQRSHTSWNGAGGAVTSFVDIVDLVTPDACGQQESRKSQFWQSVQRWSLVVNLSPSVISRTDVKTTMTHDVHENDESYRLSRVLSCAS